MRELYHELLDWPAKKRWQILSILKITFFEYFCEKITARKICDQFLWFNVGFFFSNVETLP